MSELNYEATKFSPKYLITIEMKKKTKMFMNKPVYLGLSVYIRVSKWNCNVQILVWLRKTKIQRKGKIILYGYRYRLYM